MLGFSGAQGFFVILVVMNNKSIVIFDGSNFYYKLKSLNLSHTSQFDYHRFALHLNQSQQLVAAYYCIGKIKAAQEDIKARTMMAKQQSLATRLQKEGFVIQYGFLLKTDSHYKEKGVDIQIAVDLMRGAYRNEYNSVYLVSSDSDLVPAIREVQSVGKHVVYVGFEHKPSFALLKTARESRLLTKNDLLPFFPPATSS